MFRIPRSAGIRFIEFLFIVAVLLAMRLPFTNVPFDRDEGGYAYGARIMDSGGVPYRDTFEHKGPLPFFVYRASFKLLGEQASSVHLALDLWLAAAALLLYLLASRLINRGTGFFAALSFVLLSSQPVDGAGTAALTELFLTLPVAAGALALFSGITTGSRLAVLASGLCMGLGAMSKQTAVFETLFFLAFGVLQLARGGQKRRIPSFISIFTLGFAVFPVLFLLYFLSHGALREFADYAFLYNFRYPSLDPAQGIREHVLLFLAQAAKASRGNTIILFAAAGGIFFLIRNVTRSTRAFLFGWCAASALAVFVTFRFFLHYFQQLSLPLSIIAGAGAFAGYTRAKDFLRARGIGPDKAKPFAAIQMALILLYLPLAVRAEYFTLKPGEKARAMYGDQIFAESRAIGDYLCRETSPQDTLFIFGSEPQILFYAQRKSCTPFTFTYPLWEPLPGAAALQSRVASDVREKRPRFIVYVGMPVSHLITDRSEKYLLNEMNDIIRERYDLDGVVLVLPGGTRSYLGRSELEKASRAGMLTTSGPSLQVSLHRLKEVH